MMNRIKLISTSIIALVISLSSLGQCDSIASLCAQHLPGEYISDGQSYRAFLVDDETAEFKTTFFEGTDYRIAACSGFEAQNLIFRILDEKRNVVYSNEDYDMISYWNFISEHTGEYIVEAELNNERTESGCAVILISFSR